jgi:hypothetical protein
MKMLLMLIGLVALVLGVYWLGEGMNWFNYAIPHLPSHAGDKMWGYYGGGAALAGLIIILYSRRG